MALKLLPDGTTLRDYVVGRANARLFLGVVAAVTAFLVVFVAVVLVRGVLVIPGLVFCYFVFRYTWPLRGIAVADQGVALMDRSFFHARPTRVITVVTPDDLHVAESNHRKRVSIGADVVTLRGGVPTVRPSSDRRRHHRFGRQRQARHEPARGSWLKLARLLCSTVIGPVNGCIKANQADYPAAPKLERAG